MKIYFAGSIRGGRGDKDLYAALIEGIKKHGEVLTEHIGNSELSEKGEGLEAEFIFTRDMDWVKEADIIIAEVSTPSLGVGYEIGQAEAMGKPILCLYRKTDSNLSAMISGNRVLTVKEYDNLETALGLVNEFIQNL
jgi:nucleoside 2-deoxyribosyltransferase